MKKIKKRSSNIISFLLIVSMLISSFSISTSAASSPILSVDSKTVNQGNEFTVAVKVQNVTNSVYNGNFTLKYDSSKLEVVSYTYGSIFNDHTKNCNLNYQSTGNQIRFTFSGAYALKQDGTLVTFTFRAKSSASGTSNLQFTAYKLYDENGNSLGGTANGSTITISAKPVVTSQLSLTGGTVEAGKTITVPINIGNSTGVYNGNFTLQYDSSLMTAESYTYGSIFNDHTKNCNLNYQSTGNQIRFTFSGAYALKQDGTLINITFKVKENVSGTATLQFTAYKMYDENGVSIDTVVSNGSVTVTPKQVKTLSSVSVQTKPTKTTYYIGDSLETKGLQLKLTYSDGSTEAVTSGFTTGGFSSTTAGTKTVTVVYSGKTTTFTVTVNTPAISLSSANKTMKVGDTITLTATTTPLEQSVTWTSSNTNVVTISNENDWGSFFSVSQPSSNTNAATGLSVTITAKAVGTATITAKFTYNGYTYSKTCFVTVSATPDPIVLSSISINNMPTKTVYEIGESLNTSGLVLKLAYSDGSTSTVNSGFTTSGFSSTTAGSKTITVTYGGKTVTFAVTVNATSEPINPTDYDVIVTLEAPSKLIIGKEFTLNIYMEGTYDGYSFEIPKYNNFEYKSAIPSNSNVKIDEKADRLIISTMPGLELINSPKTLIVSVIYIVNQNAIVGDMSLNLEDTKITNELGDIITTIFIDEKSVEIVKRVPGDINGDDTFDYTDVAKLYAYFRGKTVIDDDLNVDFNNDGTFDYTDVAKLYAIFRGKSIF